MDDYISREAAEQLICETCERPGCLILCGKDCDRTDRLNAIPAADVRPVVRAKWKPHPTNRCRDVCSNCGVSTLRRTYGINPDGTEWEEEESYQFCPWCAAYMRGGE